MSIESVNGIVLPGQADPATIRVTGKASQCPTGRVLVTTTATAPSVPLTVDPVSERWRVDLPVTMPGLSLGTPVSVHAACDGTPGCFDDHAGPLVGCEFTTLFFGGLTTPGSLTPSQLLVSGVVRGCAGDQVVVTSTVTAPAPPIPADPVTGAFTVILPLTTSAACDTKIGVTVACASTNGCQLTRDERLVCSECYRATVTPTYLPCVGAPPNQQQPIRFDSVIAIAAGASMTFHWDYGDTSVSPDFTINNAAGTAATTYPHSDTHPYDPGSYTATLRVVGPPFECAEVSQLVVAQCGGGGACPQIVPTPPQVAAQCVSGKRHVTLDAQVTAQAGQPVFGQWDFGDGTLGASKVVAAGATGSVSDAHDYAAPGPGQSSYTARFKIASPAGCPDVVVPVVVPSCTCNAQILNINTQVGPCNPNGTRTVTATAVPANTDPADIYYWTWDATPAVGIPAAQAMTQTHDYPAPGTGQTMQTVTLTVVRNTGCAHSFSQPIALGGCGPGAPCPQVTGLVVTAGNCPAGATTRPVNLTAQGTGGNAGSYEWNFGDGSPPVTTSTPAAPAHDYTAPSTATATVTARTPGCPDSVATEPVSVAACPPPPTTGGGGSGSPSACDVLLWVSLFFMLVGGIVAIVGCVLWHFYPIAGIIVAIIGGALWTIGIILFFIWWIVCRFLTACSVILAAIDFVSALIAVFGIITLIIAIIAAVMWQISMLACIGTAAVAWGGWGVILAMLVWLARSRRCLVPGPGSGSSSSPLTSAGSLRRSSAWLHPAAVESAGPAGLGDVMTSAFAAVGVQPCEGCAERAQRLNRRFPFRDSPPGATPG